MTYAIKEMYYTLQGEGANAGRPAVFCRFAGCNLWSGHEADRASAICQFCDTKFVGIDGPGGGKFATPMALAEAIKTTWPHPPTRRVKPLVVCTGGEPLLQLDTTLLDQLHTHGFEVAIETNGTLLPPPQVDWICVSPKAGTQLVVHKGQELKFVYPQEGVDPSDFESLDFDHLFLQPMDGPSVRQNTELATQYCLEHPRWRLSLQTHKLIGIP